MTYTEEYPAYQPPAKQSWVGKAFSVVGCGMVVLVGLVIVGLIFAFGVYHKVQDGYGNATRVLDSEEYSWAEERCEVRPGTDTFGRPTSVARVEGLFAHRAEGETRKAQLTFVVIQNEIQISESATVTTPDLAGGREFRAIGEIALPEGTSGPIGCEITEVEFTL
jgi:hypothetical protein